MHRGLGGLQVAGRDPPLPLCASTRIAVFLPYLHYMPLTSGGFQPLMLSTRGDQRCGDVSSEGGGLRSCCWSLCLPFPIAQGSDSLLVPQPSQTAAGTLSRGTGDLSAAVIGLGKVGTCPAGRKRVWVNVCVRMLDWCTQAHGCCSCPGVTLHVLSGSAPGGPVADTIPRGDPADRKSVV